MCCGIAGALVSHAAAQGASVSSSNSNKPTPASLPAAAKPSVSDSSNPLVPNALFPQWDKIKAADVQPAVAQVLREESAALDLLEADLKAAGKDVTYERIFRPYAQIRYRLDATYGLMDHLQVRAFTEGGKGGYRVPSSCAKVMSVAHHLCSTHADWPALTPFPHP